MADNAVMLIARRLSRAIAPINRRNKLIFDNITCENACAPVETGGTESGVGWSKGEEGIVSHDDAGGEEGGRASGRRGPFERARGTFALGSLDREPWFFVTRGPFEPL